MNLTSVWKNRRTGKKKSARKPKIRWQLLGLTDPNSVDNTSSMEAIRREVTSLGGIALDRILACVPRLRKASR
ncbi:MAG: hypothetical protein OJF50_002255 [Nitrospira sp.]|jgi:hypothetical protein|nr:hypothetical protein [Nitrospira sp.]